MPANGVRRRDRRAAAAVIAVAALPVIVTVVTTVAWVWHAAFAGEACHPGCDRTAADLARWTYVVAVAACFAAVVAAALHAWRTGRDLVWVPAVGAVAIVAVFFVTVGMFQRAMS